MEIIRVSPRFGVLLASMLLSVIFIIVDVCSVTGVFEHALPDGLNPWWKMATVFKCLTDSIILDDFKTALDSLTRYRAGREQLTAVTTNEDPLGDGMVDKRKRLSVARRAHGAAMTAGGGLDPGLPKPTRAHIEDYEDMEFMTYPTTSNPGSSSSGMSDSRV